MDRAVQRGRTYIPAVRAVDLQRLWLPEAGAPMPPAQAKARQTRVRPARAPPVVSEPVPPGVSALAQPVVSALARAVVSAPVRLSARSQASPAQTPRTASRRPARARRQTTAGAV